LARFLGFGRGLDFVGPGIGNGLGLGCCLHQASPTISLTSMVLAHRDRVMQNHQADLISTSLPKTARPDFWGARPISSRRSCSHPIWRTPHGFSLSGNSCVTQGLQAIKSFNLRNMIVVFTPVEVICVISQLVRANGKGFHTWLNTVMA